MQSTQIVECCRQAWECRQSFQPWPFSSEAVGPGARATPWDVSLAHYKSSPGECALLLPSLLGRGDRKTTTVLGTLHLLPWIGDRQVSSAAPRLCTSFHLACPSRHLHRFPQAWLLGPQPLHQATDLPGEFVKTQIAGSHPHPRVLIQ